MVTVEDGLDLSNGAAAVFGVDLVRPPFGGDAVFARRAKSKTWPDKPLEGWRRTRRAYGVQARRPACPPISRNKPIDAAMPTHKVVTGRLMY
jgi:hypothetical protein